MSKESSQETAGIKNQYKEIDIYRETPIRLLGYANEVGESFRAIVNVKLVWATYVVASGYCLADTIDKSYKEWKKTHKDQSEKQRLVLYQAADTLLWQGLASVAIPGFTINRICKTTGYLLNFSRLPKGQVRWLTVAAGLGSIPFIVKPIDKLVDLIMDCSLRSVFKDVKSSQNN